MKLLLSSSYWKSCMGFRLAYLYLTLAYYNEQVEVIHISIEIFLIANISQMVRDMDNLYYCQKNCFKPFCYAMVLFALVDLWPCFDFFLKFRTCCQMRHWQRMSPADLPRLADSRRRAALVFIILDATPGDLLSALSCESSIRSHSNNCPLFNSRKRISCVGMIRCGSIPANDAGWYLPNRMLLLNWPMLDLSLHSELSAILFWFVRQ